MAHFSAGADPEAALAAAEEMGEIAGDVRILKWMVGVVIALLLAGFTLVAGALFQINLRLPASSWSGGDGPKRRASEAFRGASGNRAPPDRQNAEKPYRRSAL